MNENRYQCAVWGEDSNTYYIALEIKAVQTGHRINMRSKKQCRELRDRLMLIWKLYKIECDCTSLEKKANYLVYGSVKFVCVGKKIFTSY